MSLEHSFAITAYQSEVRLFTVRILNAFRIEILKESERHMKRKRCAPVHPRVASFEYSRSYNLKPNTVEDAHMHKSGVRFNLEEEAKQLAPVIQKFHQRLLDGLLTPAEFVGLYVIAYVQLRNPNGWLVKLGRSNVPTSSMNDLADGTLSSRVSRCLRRHPDTTLHEIFSGQLLKIPISATSALHSWLRGEYPLQLVTYMPTPKEVLDMQCAGTRCVTVFVQPEELAKTCEGKDALAFLLHDLIHASNLFSDQSSFRQQVGFLRAMRKGLETGILQPLISGDPVFAFDIDYLTSDMNASCVHLVEFLKAKWIIAIARNRTGGGETAAPTRNQMIMAAESDNESQTESQKKPRVQPMELTEDERARLAHGLGVMRRAWGMQEGSEAWVAVDAACTKEFQREVHGPPLIAFFEHQAADLHLPTSPVSPVDAAEQVAQ